MHFVHVDDNRLIRNFLKTFFKSKGHTVTGFEDPRKVMDFLRAQKQEGALPDAVISDIGMPYMQGYELLEVIRSVFPSLVVVMFTGIGEDPHTMRLCQRYGCNDYVTKGVGPTEIYERVMRAIQKQAAPWAEKAP